jgi:hypothetical protein
MTPLSIPQKTHFILDSALDLTGRESFRSADKCFFGVQWTSWQRDNAVWGFREGRFNPVRAGTVFNRTIATRLRIDGSTLETEGADVLARQASGTLNASCELAYATGSTVQALEFRLYNCASETFVTQVVTRSAESVNGLETLRVRFADVAPGSYILWTRCFDSYFTFPEGNAPKSLADLLAEPRNAGEWSALKVRVGTGAFSIAAGVCPSPGAPLFVKDAPAPALAITAANQAAHRVPFDALARSVSASCVTETAIRHNDGTLDVAAGAQIMAGLRTSPNGPQCALWQLHPDLTARLLATTEVFSNGQCECGKADHHASDVAQHPDGTLYVLNECSLHRYAPNALAVGDRLPGSPALSGGHPGGQSLHFDHGQTVFSTELLTAKPRDLGFYFYNRLVLRLNQGDAVGAGTTWQGPGCIEMFRGALWGLRGDGQDLEDSETRIYLDQIVNGIWKGEGVPYTPTVDFWRQLKRRGALLFLFGFNSGGNLVRSKLAQPDNELSGTTDAPTCLIGDGKALRRADFPFFVKRATRCLTENSETLMETLMVVGDDVTTALAHRNDGRALRAVELSAVGSDATGATKICSFWDAETREFRLGKAAFSAAGGDVANLPPYLVWTPRRDSNGGGVWQPSDTLPASDVLPTDPHLKLESSGALIRYQLSGEAPYDFGVWGLLCFAILSDGSVVGIDGGDGFEPSPSATNAQEAFDAMPPGTKWRVIERPVPFVTDPLESVQVTDIGVVKALRDEREVYPCLWARFDTTASAEVLSSYTHSLKYHREQMADKAVRQRAQVVVLVTPLSQPCTLPALGRRS